MLGARHHRLAAKSLNSRHDAVVIGRNHHAVKRLAHLAVNPFYHRHAAEHGQRLPREPRRGKPRRNNPNKCQFLLHIFAVDSLLSKFFLVQFCFYLFNSGYCTLYLLGIELF